MSDRTFGQDGHLHQAQRQLARGRLALAVFALLGPAAVAGTGLMKVLTGAAPPPPATTR